MQVGDVINGHYRLEEGLSHHRTGVLFRASTLETEEPVLVRFLDFLGDRPVQKVRPQLSIVEALNHPGLVRVLETGFYRGVPFLVTGVPAGNPLSRELELAPLAMERIIHIGHEIARLLAYLHRHGVVHGDLRPANVILVPTPDFPLVRLTGFGPTAIRHPSTAPDADETYLAPERLDGGTATAGADLYALGAILYGLSTGRQPAAGAPSLSRINRRVPPSLEALIQRLLHPTPAERPADAAAVAAQLAEIGQNDLLPPPGPPSPPG